MQSWEIFNEGLSQIIYHYTSLSGALNILSTGMFHLTPHLSGYERVLAKPGTFYFLSTTRTRAGRYHYNATRGVLFVLDGKWYGARYPAKSIDYWGDRDPSKTRNKQHEAEDRIYSTDSEIPITGVIEIHVLINPKEKTSLIYAREVIAAATQFDIPTYLYTDRMAWRSLNKRKTSDTDILINDPIQSPSTTEAYYELTQLHDVIFQTDISKITTRWKNAILWHPKDLERDIETAISNASSHHDRDTRRQLTDITKFMRANRITSLTELASVILNKWKKIQQGSKS